MHFHPSPFTAASSLKTYLKLLMYKTSLHVYYRLGSNNTKIPECQHNNIGKKKESTFRIIYKKNIPLKYRSRKIRTKNKFNKKKHCYYTNVKNILICLKKKLYLQVKLTILIHARFMSYHMT